jgi:predicted RNase H-like nuclease (RuvC/YqgF family)
MYDEYEFTEQFMRDMTHNIERYVEANRNHIKGLEGKVDFLEDRIISMEKQHEQLQLLVEMLKRENEALKAYIKSGEKIIKLEKDFADDTNGSV